LKGAIIVGFKLLAIFAASVWEVAAVLLPVVLFDPEGEVAELVRLQIRRERTPATNKNVLKWTRERTSRTNVELFIDLLLGKRKLGG
jgi:hypothetical protein